MSVDRAGPKPSGEEPVRGSVVTLRGIGKQFPGVRALHDVSLAIAPGEVLGLVGENGAGKSTLIKILGGVYATYTGDVIVDGVLRHFHTTRDAMRAGISVVHQELSLIPGMSVAENLLLGLEPTRFGMLDALALHARARDILADVLPGNDIDLAMPVSHLGIGQQQILEIARALANQAKLVILDEPTAALTDTEVERLYGLIRARKASGTAFIYISHRLDEIAALCDRIAVLRDGELVGVVGTDDTAPHDIVAMMTGKDLGDVHTTRARMHPPAAIGKAVLEVEHLTVAHPNLPGRTVVHDLSFTVHAGEVVALAGAMGAGRTAALSALFGCARAGSTGTVKVDGRAVVLRTPRDAIAAGIAFVPEDRKAQGLVLDLSVADNLALSALGRLSRGGIMDDARAEQSALARLRDLSIKASGLDAEVATLSGGNQQKIVIGKWLELAPRVLLLDEPTRGVDVGAKAEIYALIEELVAKGHAVVIASSDLPEVVRLADRVIVLREGERAGELERGTNQLAIMRLAVGTMQGAHA